MREILFKAKRVDNDEWVEGSLLVKTRLVKRQCYICEDMTVINFAEACVRSRAKWTKVTGEWLDVYPETVCEFTGLLDEGNDKIFEGDILQDDFDKYIVTFEGGCFCASAKTTTTNLDELNNACTVVGNIHNKQDREDYRLDE